MSEPKLSFSRVFWPSLVAVIIASFISIVAFFIITGVLFSSLFNFKSTLEIKDNSILQVKLNGEINDNQRSTFDVASLDVLQNSSLSSLIYGIETAKADPKIKGLFIDIGNLSCGYSTAHAIRSAIIDFQNSGKFVVTYFSGEMISQKEYYIGSVAKETYAFPSSAFQLNGIGGETMFFKNLLDKLEIEVEIVRGSNNDFKSAVEPYFLTEMSDSSRVQSERLLNSIWDDMCAEMATSRRLSLADFNTIADSLKVTSTEDALHYKLIDRLKYRDEVMADLMKKTGVSNVKDLLLVDFEDYARNKMLENQLLVQADKGNVAVIIAEGDVSRNGDGISSTKICKLFEKVRYDADIKTVVFRINSPGGSALASEEIWREVALTNKVKKVIVSMGDVAASGGYYIAAPAHRIFAESTTITGSIGVFGMIPYTGKMFENKLGINFDRVETNSHSVLSLNKKLSPEELARVQGEVDGIYNQFITRVADGRKLSKERVMQIARGRVWTGKDALKIGLVDQLGSLNDAIAFAVKEVSLKNPKILYYPLVKEDKLADLLKMLKNGEEEADQMNVNGTSIPADFISYYNEIKKIENRMGIQMRLPFDIKFD
jgi:protease IV